MDELTLQYRQVLAAELQAEVELRADREFLSIQQDRLFRSKWGSLM